MVRKVTYGQREVGYSTISNRARRLVWESVVSLYESQGNDYSKYFTNQQLGQFKKSGLIINASSLRTTGSNLFGLVGKNFLESKEIVELGSKRKEILPKMVSCGGVVKIRKDVKAYRPSGMALDLIGEFGADYGVLLKKLSVKG